MKNHSHILVAVSGGIAAYKACDLVSKLSRLYDVKVMMTPNATEFVNPLTFAALSHQEVYVDEFHNSDPIPHIELAKWADLLIAAPASANLIAKAVYGLADNLVTSTFLACTCPKILCPAMNEHMLENPVTQRNLQLAKEYGWIVLDPASGYLACMDQGKGRLPDTPEMLEAIEKMLASSSLERDAAGFIKPSASRPVKPASPIPSAVKPSKKPDLLKEAEQSESESLARLDQASLHDPNIPASSSNNLESLWNASISDVNDVEFGGASEDEELYDDALAEIKPLHGKHVLISAGPTQEDMDPVRFMTNHSSGKQGYAIAEDARDWGADVILVSGPVHLPAPKDVQVIKVTSARDMEAAMQKYASWANFIIMAAAVADYRPKDVADHKIKKSDGSMLVEFVRNPDILAGLGAAKKPDQVLCGFAMETENLDANARAKLEAKNCDMLIANNLSTEGAGFQKDTNVVSLLKPGSIEHLPLQSKKELGYTILAQMLEISKGKSI